MPNYCQYDLNAFTGALASSAPTPGGGGAAALAGALAAALDGMVCALTEGKPRYDALREPFERIATESAALRQELLSLIEADATAFAPLSRAYSIPKDDPNRAAIMENALRAAAEPPMAMLRVCARGVALTAELSALGPLPAATDAGCAAVLFAAGLDCAALNLRVNTKDMKNRAAASAMNEECNALLKEYKPLAAACYDKIMEVLL